MIENLYSNIYSCYVSGEKKVFEYIHKVIMASLVLQCYHIDPSHWEFDRFGLCHLFIIQGMRLGFPVLRPKH